jgi:arylsulfatase A-like enzyme
VAEFLRDPAFNEQATHSASIPYPPEACSTSLIANKTVEFLSHWKDSGETPFCAWVSFPDPHHPLAAPEPYASMYSSDQITMPSTREGELDDKMERQRVFFRLMGFDMTPEADLRRAVAMHYGMISFLDDGVGMVLDALDRLGLVESTIVVFTADHGDYGGEHGMMLKSGTFYDCMTRVPLIVSWPGRVPKGETRDELVSNIDVMPTVMNLLGLETDRPVHGRLLPGTGGEEPRDAVFAEHGAGGPRVLMTDLDRYPDYTDPMRNVVGRLMHARNAEGRPKMIRTERWKYIYDPMDPVDELYDMDNDSWELTNVATRPEYAEVRAKLRDRLLRWSIMIEDRSATPLYSDPVTLTDTPDGGPDFYYHPLEYH